MKKINGILIFLILLLCFPRVMAQEAQSVFITDPGELYSTFDFSASEKVEIINILGNEKFGQINDACREDRWPAGISTLSERTSRKDEIRKYHVVLIATLRDKSILEIHPDKNKHMPFEMVGDNPFYFVIGTSGINDTPVEVQAGQVTEEEMFEDIFPKVIITDPGKILASCKFTEQEIKDIKEQLGEEGFEFINANCRESSFPEGMNTLDERILSKDTISLFNAFLVAETGDLSIVEITPEENEQMPESFLPVSTFYLVIRTTGIRLDDE